MDAQVVPNPCVRQTRGLEDSTKDKCAPGNKCSGRRRSNQPDEAIAERPYTISKHTLPTWGILVCPCRILARFWHTSQTPKETLTSTACHTVPHRRYLQVRIEPRTLEPLGTNTTSCAITPSGLNTFHCRWRPGSNSDWMCHSLTVWMGLVGWGWGWWFLFLFFYKFRLLRSTSLVHADGGFPFKSLLRVRKLE